MSKGETEALETKCSCALAKSSQAKPNQGNAVQCSAVQLPAKLNEW